MLPRILPLAAVATLATAGVAAAAFTPFRTPSGLVGCYYATGPTTLRCDVGYRTRFTGKRSCAGVYGQAFSMSSKGRPRVLCVSDTARDPSAPALAYGKSRHYGPYTCTSKTSGLTCRNRASHGWTLSKQKVSLF
jgi:hypothetical protein